MKNFCKFGVDTCGGINGTSLFICRDCIEDAEWDKPAATLGRSQTQHMRVPSEELEEGIEGSGENGDE